MDNYQELLEIYKIHLGIADKISERRGQANRFYITILSGVLALISITGNTEIFSSMLVELYSNFVIGILGLLLCTLWFINIRSYRQLNTGKFKTLHELEDKLSYQFLKREWEFLEKGKNVKTYLQLTRVEQFAPFILSIPYIIIIVYSVKTMFNN